MIIAKIEIQMFYKKCLYLVDNVVFMSFTLLLQQTEKLKCKKYVIFLHNFFKFFYLLDFYFFYQGCENVDNFLKILHIDFKMARFRLVNHKILCLCLWIKMCLTMWLSHFFCVIHCGKGDFYVFICWVLTKNILPQVVYAGV